jgi:hypothetical protein
MKQDALTGWSKSGFHRAPAPSAPDDDDDWAAAIAAARSRLPAARAGGDGDWDAAIAAARSRLPAARAGGDEDWDAAIARARMRHASPALVPGEVRAKLDALVRNGLKRPVAPRPSLAARRPAEEDLPTPLPFGIARRSARPLAGPAKRP